MSTFSPSVQQTDICKVISNSLLARVQYSVYIVYKSRFCGGTIKEVVVNDLLDWLQKIPGEKRWGQNDSILVLSIAQQQIREMTTIGNPSWDQDDLSGDQHTLIF